MVILLYLFKVVKSLPNSFTSLYNHFICLTISRYLSKSGNPLKSNITSLADLPEPYNRIIKQLSKLSLHALNNNRLIFTLDEITAACPDIASIPGAINGFGLLQAVQHFGLYTNTITLTFLHFTIEEFLAAYYLTLLPPDEEFRVIEENFKGQRSSFKYFLSGGNKAIAISDKFLDSQLKCLRLYRCFNEAGDQHYCQAIEQAKVFDDKVINLEHTRLTAVEMECLAVFVTSSSHRQWRELNLFSCHMQDHVIQQLYRALRHCDDIIITKLWLSYNDLTVQSGPLISEITIKCGVEVLSIAGNKTIGEDQQFYSMLAHPTTSLRVLSMWGTNLSSRAAIYLFTTLQHNKTLKRLHIGGNSITDEVRDTMTTALRSNCCLEELYMPNNPMISDTSRAILQALEDNNTLSLLGLPHCPQGDQENIKSSQVVVNKKRESRGCQVKLKIIFH